MKFAAEIEAILDPRKWPIEWVETRIADGSIALFENDGAVIGVERRHYPGGLVELHGMFAAGALESILELIDLACEAGREAGCDVAAISSRPGWGKVLASRGFETEQVRIVKELR
ncbi:MAG: hypothetical protein ACRCYS_13920 [Beijerinckiaceae bacterium]